MRALRLTKPFERFQCQVEQGSLERPSGAFPLSWQLRDPGGRFVGERSEWLRGRDPESRQKSHEHFQCFVGVDGGERHTRLASLEQERAGLRMVVEEANGAVAIPVAQRLLLVVRLVMGILQLQHPRRAVASSRGINNRDVGVPVGRVQRQLPLVAAGCYQIGKLPHPLAPLGRAFDPMEGGWQLDHVSTLIARGGDGPREAGCGARPSLPGRLERGDEYEDDRRKEHEAG